MARIHLFELEDQSWFPDFLRNYGTDFLQYMSNLTKLYEPILPILEEGIEESNTRMIIDLGSGGGGGLLWIREALDEKFPDLRIVLTDYYPNLEAFEFTKEQGKNFAYVSDPVDARAVPKELKGLRTQFLSFHHFNPNDAQQILQNAVDAQQSIAIFETQERSVQSLIAMLLSPLVVLGVTPFIRPFKWGRILFTYLIPVVPLFVLWDGMVSALRTYSVKEMKQLVDRLEGAGRYDWKIEKIKSKVGVVLYALGMKKG